MKEKIKELLPVGSIIRLEDGKKKLVVIGILQKDLDNDDLYDYITVPYPEGFVNKDLIFYVMHENIEEVIFKGYSNDEREKMLDEVVEYYENNS